MRLSEITDEKPLIYHILKKIIDKKEPLYLEQLSRPIYDSWHFRRIEDVEFAQDNNGEKNLELHFAHVKDDSTSFGALGYSEEQADQLTVEKRFKDDKESLQPVYWVIVDAIN